MKTREYPEPVWLESLASRAGNLIHRGFRDAVGFQLKKDGTPVTTVDQAINDLVLQEFTQDFPEIDVISEEGCRRVPGAQYTALCDPLDGTFPFCHGIRLSTFSLAILENGSPISAVVHDPFANLSYCAEKGSGTCIRGGQPLRVSKLKTVERSSLAVLWWKNAPYRLHDVCAKLMMAGVSWVNPGSIAIFGGLIAGGEFEGSVFPGRHGWETAAMQLLVEEAGGKATDIYGRPLKYGPDGEIEGHIMSNGLIHDELVALVQSCQ